MEGLPAVRNAVVKAGGWVLHRKSLSAASMEMRVEIQHRGVMDLYVSLIGAGVEMTRGAHLSLCEACMCTLHLPERRRKITTVEMDVTFLGDVEIPEMMPAEAALA